MKKDWRINDDGILELDVTTDQERIELHEYQKRNLKHEPETHRGFYYSHRILFKDLTP